MAGDAGIDHVEPLGPEMIEDTLVVWDDDVVHALMERRPGVVAFQVRAGQGRRVGAIEIGVLNIDHQQGNLAFFQLRVFRLGRTLVVERSIGRFPVHPLTPLLRPSGRQKMLQAHGCERADGPSLASVFRFCEDRKCKMKSL